MTIIGDVNGPILLHLEKGRWPNHSAVVINVAIIVGGDG